MNALRTERNYVSPQQNEKEIKKESKKGRIGLILGLRCGQRSDNKCFFHGNIG